MVIEQTLPDLRQSPESIPVLSWLAWYLSQENEFFNKLTPTALPNQRSKSDAITNSRPVSPEEIETTNHLSTSESPQEVAKPEIQQIPHDGDKLIMVINFLLREVMPLKSKADQVKLMQYYFRAILSESLFSPFTSLAYSIQVETGGLKLHDDIYQMRPDVVEVCRVAADSVKDGAEKRRYELEHVQIKQLIERIGVLFVTGHPPHALIELITSFEVKKPDYATVFQAFGWQSATNLISPEAANKLELPTHKLEHYAGKKISYLMPQSEVHQGNMSVLVIAQPVFIPSLNRLVLLHDQCFYPSDWTSHLRLMKRLGVNVPTDLTKLAKKINPTQAEIQAIEAFVLSQVVTLNDHQLEPAKQVLTKLTDKQGLIMKLKDWWKQQEIKLMEPSLRWYAELIVELMQRETDGKPLSTQKVTKLSLFLKRIVFAGILTKEKITQSSLSELLQLYYGHAHQSEETFSKTAAVGFNFSAAIKSIDTSWLECVSIGAINGFGAKNLLAKFNLGEQLTQSDLINAIGADRAKKWQEHKSCSTCPATDTWVGECGLCFSCETRSNAGEKLSAWNSTVSNKAPDLLPKITPPKAKPASTFVPNVSIGSFVAGLV